MLDFIEVCRRRQIGSCVISDETRIDYPTASYGSFRSALESRSVEYQILERLTCDALAPLNTPSTILMCVNCVWKIQPDVITLFNDRIFNYHNASMPDQRGAAAHSWRLMQGACKSRMTIHEVAAGLDEGRIVVERPMEYPEACRTLKASYEYLAQFEAAFFDQFLDAPDRRVSQDETESFYWPRLNTAIHGFIDWAWTAEEIMSFCAAFDEPFAGASTFLNGRLAFLRAVDVVDRDVRFHPFQAGLIYRKATDHICVAAKGGGLRIGNATFSTAIKYRVGHRFVTPPEYLHLARLGKARGNG